MTYDINKRVYLVLNNLGYAEFRNGYRTDRHSIRYNKGSGYHKDNVYTRFERKFKNLGKAKAFMRKEENGKYTLIVLDIKETEKVRNVVIFDQYSVCNIIDSKEAFGDPE